MFATVQEAAHRNCPFFRPEFNVWECQGDSCMAWRWYTDRVDSRGNHINPAQRVGYCGLAGKPEVR
jgi:hypothetical protein